LGVVAWKGIWSLLLIGGVLFLGRCALYLAAMRLYQVDECMEVYVARTLAAAQNQAAAGNATLFQVMLSWLFSGAGNSVELFTTGRLVMVVLFLTNWILIAMATGERLFSMRWLVALAGAATLAPLWDYGFEIRHDNLLLTGLLVMWGLARFRPARPPTCAALGALAVGLEFVAAKALMFTLPFCLAFLLFPPAGGRDRRWKLALAWVAGAATSLLLIRIALGLAGLWNLVEFNFLAQASEHGNGFGPGLALSRLLTQAPLLLAVWTAGMVAVALDLRRRGKAALSWEGNVPEALLCTGAFAALLVDPASFPSGLLYLVPFVFLFSYRYASGFLNSVPNLPGLYPLLGNLLVFAHLVPFALATQRVLAWPNTRQEQLIRLSEALTVPGSDPVFDGVGMVPTRSIVDNQAFLHCLNPHRFVNRPGPQVRDMLAARPPAVILPNYLTDQLPETDHAFVREHYVELSDDIWVLGEVLPPGGGTFQVIRAGRYRIAARETSDLLGTYPEGLAGLIIPKYEPGIEGTIDGAALAGRPVNLAAGSHRLQCAPGARPAIVWVGPSLERLPRLGQGDHQAIFHNWY
jgi:hypothetical protein